MIKVPASSREDGEEEDEAIEDGPGFASSKSGRPAANPFAMVQHLATNSRGGHLYAHCTDTHDQDQNLIGLLSGIDRLIVNSILP